MRHAVGMVAIVAMAAGCATVEREVEGPARKETLVGVTESMRLVRFNGGQPQRVTAIGTIRGLQPGESLVGIDYRVARGVLFGLGSTGRLYTIDARTAQAQPVGGAALAVPLAGRDFGFDFNPAVDRIRIVSNSGQNMRGHPDTGASVDGNTTMDGVQGDAALVYASGDRNAGQSPRIVGAGYTYNKQNDKITNNFAIDAATGSLVMQGSREGATPAVSPNTGQFFTVGSLGIGRFGSASFDISDVNNSAYLSADLDGRNATRLYSVDLASATATFIGTVGGGERRDRLANRPAPLGTRIRDASGPRGPPGGVRARRPGGDRVVHGARERALAQGDGAHRHTRRVRISSTPRSPKAIRCGRTAFTA